MAEKILYVEDNDFFSQVVGNALQKRGYEVTIAQDGQEGLDVIKKEPFNLVFLDLLMPNVDGFEVLERSREHFGSQPGPIFAVLSNISSEEDMKRARELGAREFLIKATSSPQSIADLADRLLGKPVVESPPTVTL